MVWHIRVSWLAEADLEAIGDYIAEFNPQRAKSFTRELRGKCGDVLPFPEAWPLREDLGENLRGIFHGDYLILYTTQLEEIVIERIVHGARDLGRILL